MKRIGLLVVVTGSVAIMSALTFTTVHAVQHNESPKEALVQAPKAAVEAVSRSLHKLAAEVKPSGADKEPVSLEFAVPETSNTTTVDTNSEPDPASLGIAYANAKIFEVMRSGRLINSFDTFADAVTFAKTQPDATIVYKSQNAVVWTAGSHGSGAAHIDVPLTLQMPELERGCEVTSLAMLLEAAGVQADKMTLAQQVKKDPTPFEMKDGQRYFGDPNNGFVGDIETFDNPGYGVYHGPIKELADQYLPGRAIDLTGADFTDMLSFLDLGSPIWTIVNTDYEALSDDEFEQWISPDGPVNITYKEHSVLVTGYDDEYIYINDPLNETDKVDKDSFIAAWEQMGKQAISYVPKLESKAGKT
ncbi:C39 family peptidase [Gordoniibacillus kamchatkensis]|uniref:C39 family peptidase n=1 Tax=Gordoniibacillus kamchatkensis TaxID=1590651 RepID=UPI0006967A5D|nr:C39 family peptidase [Paenibacillus sp. VKM B-2647]